MASYLELSGRLRRIDSRLQSLGNLALDVAEFNRELVPALTDFEVAMSALLGVPPPEESAFGAALHGMLHCQGGTAGRKQLHQLNRALTSNSGCEIRTTPLPSCCPNHEPLHPAIVPSALERFWQWVESEGFQQMHTIEQLVVTQIRLLEIAPFENFSLATTSLFGYWKLLTAGCLWPTWRPGSEAEACRALSEGFLFSTTELLQLWIEGCEKSFNSAEFTLGIRQSRTTLNPNE